MSRKDHKLIEGDFYDKLIIFLTFCSFYGDYNDYKHLYKEHMDMTFIFNIKPLPTLNPKYLDENDSKNINSLFHSEFSRIFQILFKELIAFRKKNILDEKIQFPYHKYKGKRVNNIQQVKKELFKNAFKKNKEKEKELIKKFRFHPEANKLKQIFDGIELEFGLKNIMEEYLYEEIKNKELVSEEYLKEYPSTKLIQNNQEKKQLFENPLKNSLNFGLEFMIDFDEVKDCFEEIAIPEEGTVIFFNN